MLLIPAGVAALVTVYCLGCVAHRGWRDPGTRAAVGVELGHAVMGATMLAMLLDVLPATWVSGAFGVFGATVVVCAVRGIRTRAVRARYLRLGVLCASMLPMLVPATTATAAPSGMRSAAGGSHQLMSVAADTTMSAGRAIDLLLIAALLTLIAARLAGSSRAGQSVHCHLHTMCEVAMAATTGCMLAAML